MGLGRGRARALTKIACTWQLHEGKTSELNLAQRTKLMYNTSGFVDRRSQSNALQFGGSSRPSPTLAFTLFEASAVHLTFAPSITRCTPRAAL
jgi:hypothetical protein